MKHLSERRQSPKCLFYFGVYRSELWVKSCRVIAGLFYKSGLCWGDSQDMSIWVDKRCFVLPQDGINHRIGCLRMLTERESALCCPKLYSFSLIFNSQKKPSQNPSLSARLNKTKGLDSKKKTKWKICFCHCANYCINNHKGKNYEGFFCTFSMYYTYLTSAWLKRFFKAFAFFEAL